MLTNINFEIERNLEYGANSHQLAQIYNTQNPVDYELLSEGELKYNEILNLTTGLDIISEFFDVKAVAITKLGMPCSVALGKDYLEAFQKAFDTDPISSLNSTITFSGKIDENVAILLKKMAFDIVCATDYTQKALNILLNTGKIKVVRINTPLEKYRSLENCEIKVTPFGTLVQSQDKKELSADNFKVVTKNKPSQEQVEDAVFAWKIAKHAKSEAVVIAKDFKTLAISQGNTNCVTAFEHALDYACNDSKDAVLALDGQIPTTDSLNAAIQGRIGLIIQTGSKSTDIIKFADKYNLIMIETGISHTKM